MIKIITTHFNSGILLVLIFINTHNKNTSLAWFFCQKIKVTYTAFVKFKLNQCLLKSSYPASYPP